jgi:hypothetical protein
VLNSAVIDVTIGLAFIFLLVSLLVTAGTEMVSGYLRWRSTHLWEGLGQLMQSAELRQELYDHPLIRGLARVGIGKPEWDNGRNGPSYIPSRTFALALLDILKRPHLAAAKLDASLQGLPRNAAIFSELDKILSGIGDDAPEYVARAAKALRDQVFGGEAKAEALSGAPQERVDEALRAIDTHLKGAAQRWLRDPRAEALGALMPLMHDAADDVDRFRENVETWFNDGMDRVSGWYKRKTTHVQAFIAFGLAVFMNIDALQITRTLWREPTLRQALVANAERQTQQPPPAAGPNLEADAAVSRATFNALQQQVGSLGLPIGWSCPGNEAGSGAQAPMTDPTDKTAGLGVSTIGGPFWCSTTPGNSGHRWFSWSWWGLDEQSRAAGYDTTFSRLGMLLSMILGWAITAAAASLGAPFWFDTLKRVVSIRSSGKAPEERPLPPKVVPQPTAPGQRPIDAALLNALRD